MLAPSRNFTAEYDDLRAAPAYPWSVVPDEKVTVQRAFEIHRSHYEGTPFDPSRRVAAGPFGRRRVYGLGVARPWRD